MNKWVSILVRLSVSLAILGFVVWNAWKDATFRDNFWKLVSSPAANWYILVAAWLVSLAAVMITMVRWHLLVVALGLPFKFRDALRLGFLGYMLNLVSPGSVGGDLFKAIFIAREHPQRRAEAVATVVLDRIIGLYGLFLVASIAIFSDGLLHENMPRPIRVIVVATLVCTAIGAVGIAMLLIPGVTSGRMSERLSRLPKVGGIAVKLIEAIRIYSQKPLVLAINVVLSMIVHLFATTSVYMIATGTPGVVPTWLDHFVAVPLAMVAGAIPALPAGLGAIEIVIDYLYTNLPTGLKVTPGQGLLVAVGYRITTLLNAAVGGVIYLFNRREVDELMHEAQEPHALEHELDRDRPSDNNAECHGDRDLHGATPASN
ncbi:MAG: flippase-like domain-containing protein [Pirellulales bacterium]|nr:flippase-like domain-containing protein [Pirellulales bacterium]